MILLREIMSSHVACDMLDANLKNLKKKTLDVIRQWVDISLCNHVAKETDPYTLWKNLENMYETKSA